MTGWLACRAGKTWATMNQHLLRLHGLGQRLWLDDISRTPLRSGRLQRVHHRPDVQPDDL